MTEPRDQVLAYNEATQTTAVYTVTAVMVHDDPSIVVLDLDGERIETTPEHPFFTAEDGWVPAGDLTTELHIRKVDGTYGQVRNIVTEQRTQTMYNLTVAVAHTFFVGEGQWLVHNQCDSAEAFEGAASLSARVDSQGVMWFVVKVPPSEQRKGVGARLFQQVWDELGGNSRIKAIGGDWGVGSGMQDNLNTFNEALALGASETAAALETFTGRMADRRGYKTIDFVKRKPEKHPHTHVVVLFKKE